jgi:hypothetical protein
MTPNPEIAGIYPIKSDPTERHTMETHTGFGFYSFPTPKKINAKKHLLHWTKVLYLLSQCRTREENLLFTDNFF